MFCILLRNSLIYPAYRSVVHSWSLCANHNRTYDLALLIVVSFSQYFFEKQKVFILNPLPDSLCGNIFSKWDNCYLLRGHEVPAICRNICRFIKDSLAYRGFILWNLVNYNDNPTNVSFEELKKQLTTREYFKDFIFDGTAVPTLRHRVSDYVYF